jgi:hypothetical protein
MIIFFLALGTFAILGFSIFLALQRPSNDGNWAPDVAILPEGTLCDGIVRMKNIRAFRYATDGSMKENRFDQTFPIEDILSVDLFIEPFSAVIGPAHSLLSFSLRDGQHIVISVEVRRKENQRNASFWLSFLRQYGLIYVVADEEDAVFLRSHVRKDKVFLHPLRLTPEESQKLFLDMLGRINALKTKPELYNLSSNTCATNIRTHLNAVLAKKLPFHPALLFPVFFPRYLFDRGLIDTALPFADHEARAIINDKPARFPLLPFSEAIRK